MDYTKMSDTEIAAALKKWLERTVIPSQCEELQHWLELLKEAVSRLEKR